MLRTTFSTSRLLDFFSEKELTAQVGLGSGFGLWAATAQGEMACNVERERQSLPKPVAADSPKPATAVARKRARRPGESFHALRGGRAGSRRSDGDRAAYGLYGVGKKGTRSVLHATARGRRMSALGFERIKRGGRVLSMGVALVAGSRMS
jgi:hypothetical protein